MVQVIYVVCKCHIHEDRKPNKYASNNTIRIANIHKKFDKEKYVLRAEVKQKVKLQKKKKHKCLTSKEISYIVRICFTYTHKNWYTSWTDPIMTMKTEEVNYNVQNYNK